MRGRDIGACLGKDSDKGVLAKEGAFASHVRAGDEPCSLGFADGTVVADEGTALLFEAAFDGGMAAAEDFEGAA